MNRSAGDVDDDDVDDDADRRASTSFRMTGFSFRHTIHIYIYKKFTGSIYFCLSSKIKIYISLLGGVMADAGHIPSLGRLYSIHVFELEEAFKSSFPFINRFFVESFPIFLVPSF